jgi:hypothetical protein
LVRRPLTGLLYQPRMIYDECGVVGGMRTGRGNRSTRRKPAPVPLRPPKIPHELTWARSGNLAINIVSHGTAIINGKYVRTGEAYFKVMTLHSFERAHKYCEKNFS